MNCENCCFYYRPVHPNWKRLENPFYCEKQQGLRISHASCKHFNDDINEPYSMLFEMDWKTRTFPTIKMDDGRPDAVFVGRMTENYVIIGFTNRDEWIVGDSYVAEPCGMTNGVLVKAKYAIGVLNQ